MNIGFLVDFKWYPPQGGGMVHAYQVSQQMIKRGHSLHAMYYYDEAPGLKLYRQRNTFKFLKAIDLLYIRIHGAFGPEKFTLLKALSGFSLPVVWEVNAPLEGLLTKDKTAGQLAFTQAVRRFLARGVDACICISKEVNEHVSGDLRIKDSYVVPNGSDPQLFSPEKRRAGIFGSSWDGFKVIWSGSSNYVWQGTDIIIEVAKRMLSRDKNVVFVLITQAKHLRRFQPLPKNVLVVDQKQYLELPPYIASADAGLCLYHPYGWKGKFYFSPLKLFDYMASGLPIIATGVGQIGEVVENNRNGFLVKNNIDEIIGRILYLKNNPDAGKNMGAQARNDVINYYNWDRVGKETESILKSHSRATSALLA